MFQRSSTYIMTAKGMPILMKRAWPHRTSSSPSRTQCPSCLASSSRSARWPSSRRKTSASLVVHLTCAMRAQKGLTDRGYKLNFGEDGSGFHFLALKRACRYYISESSASSSAPH